MKSAHILQPGDKLLRDGSWVDGAGMRHKSPCVDPERAAADDKPKRGRPKGPPKKKGN